MCRDCDEAVAASAESDLRDQRIRIQVWAGTQNPAISRFANSDGNYRVYWTDKARLMRDHMLVVDYVSMMSLNQAVDYDPDLRAYLEKRPLILILPDGPVFPLSEAELKNRRFVGATIVGNNMESLRVALCQRQLTPEIQDFHVGVQVTEEMLLQRELTLGDMSLSYRLRLHIDGCGSCRTRLEEEFSVLQAEIKLVREAATSLINQAHRSESKDKERQRSSSADTDPRMQIARAIASEIAKDDPAAAEEFMGLASTLLNDDPKAASMFEEMAPADWNPFGL